MSSMDDLVKSMLKKASEVLPNKVIDLEQADLEYNETTFWTAVKTKNIPKIPENDFVALFQDLVFSLINPGKGLQEIYTLALLLASQMKDPTDTSKFLLPVITPDNTTLPAASKNWYQREKSVSITQNKLRQEMHTKAGAATYKEIAVWGPFFAAIVCRFERRNTNASIAELAGINDNYAKFYRRESSPIFQFPSKEELKKALINLQTAQFESVTKNSIFLAMINIQINPEIDQAILRLLDYTFLQGLRYTGMQVVKLTQQVIDAYDIPEIELVKHTMYTSTISSWKYYIDVIEKFATESTFQDNPRWMYAREFFPAAFQGLNFRKTSFLCQLLAALLDEKLHPSTSPRTPDVPGPIYLALTAGKTNIDKIISERLCFHTISCKKIHLRIFFCLQNLICR